MTDLPRMGQQCLLLPLHSFRSLLILFNNSVVSRLLKYQSLPTYFKKPPNKPLDGGVITEASGNYRNRDVSEQPCKIMEEVIFLMLGENALEF